MAKQNVFVGGNSRGHFSCKFNRVAKLSQTTKSLEKKLWMMYERGSANATETSRAALATLVMLQTGVRIGNERSAEGYVSLKKETKGKTVQTYGLCTILPEHVRGVKNVYLNFSGKREVAQSIKLDARLSKAVSSLPMDETVFDLTHYQVTKFVHKYVGKKFMPKDFRTLVANQVAWKFIQTLKPADTKKEFKSNLRTLCERVSLQLGNTPAMAKKAYINHELFDYIPTNF
jgi:DNA topoisomerase-1